MKTFKAFGVIAFLMLSGSAWAQTSPVIKGHAVGETSERFMREDADLKIWTDYCRRPEDARGAKPLLPAHPFMFDGELPPMFASLCDWLAPVSSGERLEIRSTESGAAWTIESGKVVSLTMLIPASNDAALADAVKKFGVPTAHAGGVFQNSFGATWKSRVVTWDRPGFFATLYQDGNPIGKGRSPYLKVETSSEHAREGKIAVHRPNSLN
jgi:hypothetical protein